MDNMIQVLLALLEVEKIPGLKNYDTLESLMIAASCLSRLAHKCCGEPSLWQPRVKDFAEGWMCIAAWIMHFHRYCVQDATLTSHRRAKSAIHILQTVDEFARGPFSSALNSTPEVGLPLIDIWILEVSNRVFHPSNLNAPTSRVLVNFFKTFDPAKPPTTESLRGIGRDTRDIARVALTRLKNSIAEKDSSEINVNLFVLNYFSENADILLSLLSQGSTVTVTQLVVSLTSESGLAKYEFALYGKKQCFAYLLKALEVGESCTWVIQALDEQIIRSILRSQLFGADILDCLALMCNILPKHLIYFSVLKAARRALDHVQDTHLENEITLSDPIKTTWIEFKDLAWSRCAEAELWHKTHKEEVVYHTCRYSGVGLSYMGQDNAHLILVQEPRRRGRV